MISLLTCHRRLSVRFRPGLTHSPPVALQRRIELSVGALASVGAVSGETVAEMAEGVLRIAGSDADVAVAVSGVAGPGGGSPEKPVGTVWATRRGAQRSKERATAR